MIAEVHLVSPVGVSTQRQVGKICEMLREDNMTWIAGRVNSGLKHTIPLGAKAAGIRYQPPNAAEKRTPKQIFRSAPYMFSVGHGSCCDIAPFDAAVLTLLYDIPSRTMAPPQGGTSLHCNVLTPWGVYDPTLWWNKPQYRLPPLEWGAQLCRQAVQKLVQEGGGSGSR